MYIKVALVLCLFYIFFAAIALANLQYSLIYILSFSVFYTIS